MKKEMYEAPQAEVLEVSAEGVFCTSGLEGQNLESWNYEEFQW